MMTDESASVTSPSRYAGIFPSGLILWYSGLDVHRDHRIVVVGDALLGEGDTHLAHERR